MKELPRVILLLETSLEYGRALLRGISRYERLHGPWSLHVLPGHFQHQLPELASGGQVGIVARMTSVAEADAIERSGWPAVVLEPSVDDPRMSGSRRGFHQVVSDSPAVARLAADHLIGVGLTEFAYCGFARCPWSVVRQKTFTSYLAEHGFECTVFPDPGGGDGRWAHDPNRLETWLRTLPTPVGVMACNDTCGRQVLEACLRAGRNVPDEVAVVGVDNDELICHLATPALTSVALDLEAAGFAAAGLLDRLLSGGHQGGPQVLPVRATGVVGRRSTEPVLHASPLIAKALRFIRDHAGHPMGVQDVCARMGTSRRTLERRFQENHGRGVSHEIASCRLNRAARLLAETDLPVYRVAEASGFGSVQPMLRLFQKRIEMTPAQYRQSVRPRQAG
jgi:LacI family transcriptional regulator